MCSKELSLLLTEIFGSLSAVESGSGFRCKTACKGKITLYKSGLRLVIAEKSRSMAARAGKSPTETSQFLAELKVVIGRNTEQNLHYNWPRVGFSSVEEAQIIATRLRQFFGMEMVKKFISA
jgi:hypothetical protein